MDRSSRDSLTHKLRPSRYIFSHFLSLLYGSIQFPFAKPLEFHYRRVNAQTAVFAASFTTPKESQLTKFGVT
jgi:hypothetical protein